MVNVYKTKLDIKAVRHAFKPVIIQYDHVRLEIELLDGGLPYDLLDVVRVEFTHVRKDEAVIIHQGEIVTIDGRRVICYEYQGTEMDELGVVQASFALFDEENRKVSTHKFEVIIRPDLRDETFSPAEPNYGKLQTLIADVAYIKEHGGSGGIGLKGETGDIGPQGERGVPGYTPIKGVDYFDGKDGRDGKDGYTPIKGVDYSDGINGKDGRDGAQGLNGEPFTYTDFTPTQLEALRGPKGDSASVEDMQDLFDDLSAENIKIPIIDESDLTEIETEVEIAFDWINGYRDSADGVLKNGTGWKTTQTAIPNSGETVYRFVHPITSNPLKMRLLGYAGSTFGGSLIVTCNEDITITGNITSFAFNASISGSLPESSITPFPNLESIEQLQLFKVVNTTEEGTPTEKLVPIGEVINSIERRLNVKDRTLKVLMVGNSFSEDVSQYIHSIANSSGVNAIFGNLYRPGESLEGHLTQINSNANSYTFHVRSSLNGQINHVQTPNVSFLTALKSEKWDIITYQQSSSLSGVAESFSPFLESIIDFVNLNKTNPNLRHTLHMTWAYPSSSTESGFANYSNNQQTMYTAIVNAYQQAMFDNDIDLVIPVGTAIQNARTISYLQTLHNDLASDGYHLGEAGDFIGGLTIFEVLIAAKYKKDIFEDVTVSLPNSKYHAYLSKLAVKNAVLNPFNITDI